MSPIGKSTSEIVRASIFVTGVVQGVGFRPFIHRLATSAGLAGHVLNTSEGVEIEVEGPAGDIERFISSIREQAPPLSRINDITAVQTTPDGQADFVIKASVCRDGRHQLVSPDSCTCEDCLTELLDPGDRRYRYPFINCTNCGPRFTIIEGLPYDRPLTTMKKFQMCPACLAEYEDPADRRFHAEPNACPECGPHLWLSDRNGEVIPVQDAIGAAADSLREGMTVALKSLGGFQLACLATDAEAVALLRRRKRRPHKPFALMVPSLDDAALYCDICKKEEELLVSPQRPIVLLACHGDNDIADSVAPELNHLGIMLPYTPLHFLLMRDIDAPLVMTSGNLSEEPICRTNTEAIGRLSGIADRFLLHNRGIRSTYDDSVMMAERNHGIMLRRARGYAPLPVKLPLSAPPTLATGAELKNSFCLTSGDDAFISQHIGDLENAETLFHLEYTESLYEKLFDIEPLSFACDKHPGYLSTAYCLERTDTPIKIQHHRAHVASCLVDNNCLDKVVGVSFDGTGFGDDGLIWGGEFFAGGLESGLTRAAHLDCFPLLGGEAAIREPWRTALAVTWQYSPDDFDRVCDRFQIAGSKKELILRQLQSRLNCPMTSSCGRLFDAVAALIVKRTAVSYEAQAAMELEALAGKDRAVDISDPGIHDRDSMSYRFSLDRRQKPWRLSPARAISRVIADLFEGEQLAAIARSFHAGLADGIVRTCLKVAAERQLDAVALSGGVFQNRLLLRLVIDGLEAQGVRILMHGSVPPNDGGISLGQAVMAMYGSRAGVE